jgi:hypothetical protein
VHPFVESIFAVPREEGFAAPILQQEIQPAGVPPPKTSPPDTQTSQPAAIGETVIERPSQLLDPRPAQRSARVPTLPPAAPAAGNASLPTAASSAGRENFQPLLPQPAHSEQEKEASTLPLPRLPSARPDPRPRSGHRARSDQPHLRRRGALRLWSQKLATKATVSPQFPPGKHAAPSLRGATRRFLNPEQFRAEALDPLRATLAASARRSRRWTRSRYTSAGWR